MCSPSALNLASFGFPAIGLTVRTVISGFRARGWSRRKSVCSGLQGTGDGLTISMYGTSATGDQKSATTVELTTASATPALASSVATGETTRTTTTAQ